MTIALPEANWRLSTPGGIKKKTISRSGTFTEEDASVTEVYVIKAANLLDFAQEAFPAPFVTLGGVIYPPRLRVPGLGVMGSKKVSWEAFVDGKPVDPFGADSGADPGTYDEDIKVTVEYGTSAANDDDPDENSPLTFLEITANASGEFLNVPNRGTAVWESITGGANDPVREVNVPRTITEPIVEWTVKWNQIPFVFFNGTLLARLRAALGKVNSTASSLFFDAPAQTVLFVGWSMQFQFTWRNGQLGTPPVSLEMKFLEKNFVSTEGISVTHNHTYRPGVGYRRLLVDGAPTYALTLLDTIVVP